MHTGSVCSYTTTESGSCSNSTISAHKRSCDKHIHRSLCLGSTFVSSEADSHGYSGGCGWGSHQSTLLLSRWLHHQSVPIKTKLGGIGDYEQHPALWPSESISVKEDKVMWCKAYTDWPDVRHKSSDNKLITPQGAVLWHAVSQPHRRELGSGTDRRLSPGLLSV